MKQYRKVVSLLVAAVDERDVRQLKSRRLEQLKGDRKGQSSLRLHEGHRLIVTFRTEPAGRVVAVVEIIKHDDY